MTTPPAPHHDPNYARLDQRVTGLEQAVSGIASAISDLGKKLDERSRPQWMLLVGALGLVITLLGVIGAAWKAPIDGIVARQEMDLRDLRDDMVPRVEIDTFSAFQMRERDDVRSRLDRLEGHVLKPGGGL